MNQRISAFLGLPKSLVFNIRTLGIKKGIWLPIILGYRTQIKWKYVKKGSVEINNNFKKTGIVKIGLYTGMGVNETKTIIDIRKNGKLIFECDDSKCIATGSYVMVEDSSIVFMGAFHGGNNLKLISRKGIELGKDVLTSWNCTIMDSDGHVIIDQNTRLIRNDNECIKIGNHVWICANCSILKGTVIPNNIIIGANSTLTKKLDTANAIYGNYGKVIAKNVDWIQ